MIAICFKDRSITFLVLQLGLLFIASVVSLETIAQSADGPDGPLELVEITVREAFAEVRENEALYRNNGDQLQAMVEERIAPHFNFERMTQLAVAQNWRNATEDERAALTSEFKKLLIRSYANVTYDFRTELPNIDITPRSISENRAVIRGEVRTNTGQRVVLDVRMENRAQHWQVIDVMVDGVSLIVNYRASFAYEIEQGGFTRLIETLRAENNKEWQSVCRTLPTRFAQFASIRMAGHCI